MKCHYCSREVKLWQSYCPHCQGRLQKNAYSTIAETTETLEQHSRRRLVRQTLQFALLAVTLIALASVMRFSPPKASPLPNANLSVPANSVPSPAPTPEQVAQQEAPSATPALPVSSATPTPVAKLAPGAVVSDLPANTRVAVPPNETVLANRPRLTASAVTLADEAAPKKAVTTPLVTTPAPAVPAPAPAVEAAEPRLEVESSGVLLTANTGLVTIKSYVPARVYIDGLYSGTTPRSVKLLAGDHVITLLANGHQDYTRKVKVSGQQQMGILASMNKK
jgi:hypothetical protein